MLRGKPEPIEIPLPEQTGFSLDSGGTWTEGDISINPTGITIVSSDNRGLCNGPTDDELAKLQESLANSEIQPDDLKVLETIGHGSSGTVQKVLHIPSNSILALKVIPLEAEERVRKNILLELKTLHQAVSPQIVSFYGAFYKEGAVHIALEYMDGTLLDIMKATGPIPEVMLAKIAVPVLHGLLYLHKQSHVIHRDIKPSNLLVDMEGRIKIADFGVSGQLQSSLSKCASWVGTVHYMSPERISGGAYGPDSDLWSLGLSLLEMAMGRFPYPPSPRQQRMGFWDLLDYIVEEPAPRLPPHMFSQEFASFVEACLQKEADKRPSAADMLKHPFLHGDASGVSLADWIRDSLAKVPPRRVGKAGLIDDMDCTFHTMDLEQLNDIVRTDLRQHDDIVPME